jgi:hypothetical protein
VDPLTLTGVAATGLAEGIKFLYGQTAEILKRRREKRAAEDPVVEVAESPVAMEGEFDRLTIDPDAAERLEPQLKTLYTALTLYAQGIEPADVDDEGLLRTVDALRRVLEAVYHQRFTFAGEARPPSGPLVEGEINVKEVEGYVAAVEAELIASGHVIAKAIVDRVGPGGTAVGVKVKHVGGTRGG